ncbi:MAG: ATP-binding protein, partial [Actinobacteria bacterium]|nr:ATP-binding protein [Actinomycetota bacterium]
MHPPLRGHVRRRLTSVLEQRLREEPVIALQGPRSVGKSTLLAEIAAAHGVQVIDLDDPQVLDALRANPTAYLATRPPVCIDEYQKLPLILDAMKARLNRSTQPGNFVITGSTRYSALPVAAQSLTGRLHVITILPLSQGEIAGHHETFLEDLCIDPDAAIASAVAGSPSLTSRQDYIDRVHAGGLPLALSRPTMASQNRWFDDYLRLVLDRDVIELSRVRQREQLPRLLARIAGQTAQVLNIAKVAQSIGMDTTTAENYVNLLEAVFLLSRLPAWGATLRARTAAKPKVHMVDSGIAARLLRLTPNRMATLEPAALTEFGHLLETFVVGELLKQATWIDGIPAHGHWRTHDGDEVDLVFERDDGAVLAFEIKTGSRVPGESLRSLRKLREATGSRFLAGMALCTGDRTYTFEDRIHVMPIDRL